MIVTQTTSTNNTELIIRARGDLVVMQRQKKSALSRERVVQMNKGTKAKVEEDVRKKAIVKRVVKPCNLKTFVRARMTENPGVFSSHRNGTMM